ncbi:MAG: RNA methyltransferase, partial [Gammaproteobacteria bacterium]|nr:RNA methyltransferase [Gammaproteobacteria bacterium]
VSAVIAPKDRSVGLTPAVHKVSSGASSLVTLFFVTNLVQSIKQLKEHGVWVYGCSEKAEQSIYQCKFNTHPSAFVLGNEGSGLRHLTKTHCDHLVSIPMFGQITSLNVSVSCGIILYEWVRQVRNSPSIG